VPVFVAVLVGVAVKPAIVVPIVIELFVSSDSATTLSGSAVAVLLTDVPPAALT
jgi:hypothetical protein